MFSTFLGFPVLGNDWAFSFYCRVMHLVQSYVSDSSVYKLQQRIICTFADVLTADTLWGAPPQFISNLARCRLRGYGVVTYATQAAVLYVCGDNRHSLTVVRPSGSPANFRGSRIQGALRGHLCDSTAFLYIHDHTTAFRWYNCQWPWAYFNVIGLFHIKFLKNGVWYGKSYYRQLIRYHTLAFDWCHFWWPWSTFEGHSA